MSSLPERRFTPRWLPDPPAAPRLAEALSHVSLEEQQRIAYRCQLSCGTHSKSQLIQAIGHALRRPSFVAGLVEHLSADELAVLDHLFWTRTTFHKQERLVEDLLAGVIYDAEADWERANQILDSLGSFGLVLNRTDEVGAVEYFIPSDVASSIRGFLDDRPQTNLKPVKETVEPRRPLPFLFLENLFDFVAFIHKNPVRMTADQRIFKRAQDSIRDSLAHPSINIFLPESEDPLWLPGHWDLLMDVIRHLRLLNESGDELQVSAEFHDWVTKPRHELAWDVLNALVDIRFGRERYDAILLEQVRTFEPGRWYARGDLVLALRQLSMAPATEGTFQMIGDWMGELLYVTGLLEIGRIHDQHPVYKATPLLEWMLGYTDEPPVLEEPFQIALQPNFEVLLPARAALSPRWTLEQFADLQKRDMVMTYILHKESVYRYMKRGGDVETMLEFLDEYTPRPLPQNIEFSIREWTEAYGAVTFLDVIVLHCRTAQLSEEIEATKTIAPYLRGRLSPTDLIVAREHARRVQEEMTRLGYLPDPEIRKE